LQNNSKRLKILFVCTANACRSQMAEGWARHLKGEVIEPYSAGVCAVGLSDKAVKVMAEAGVDISRQWSKTVDELKDTAFDYVVTLCSHAHRFLPAFRLKTTILHFPFDDPPSLAAYAVTEEEALVHYRRVRDEIKKYVEKLPGALFEKNG
jgi:arsenate reductase